MRGRLGFDRALIPNVAGTRVRVCTHAGWIDDVVVFGPRGHALATTSITDVISWLPIRAVKS